MSFSLFSFELKEIFSSFPVDCLECWRATWCWPFEEQQKSRQRKNITLKWQKKPSDLRAVWYHQHFSLLPAVLFYYFSTFTSSLLSLATSSSASTSSPRFIPTKWCVFALALVLFVAKQTRKKCVYVLGRHHSATPRDNNIFARNLMKQFFLLCCCCFASRRIFY